MAGSFTEGAHWRDTARPVKLWIVNSNATFPIVFALFHIRWWTMSLALAAVVALSVLEYYGFTIVVFGRYLRNLLAGSRRLAIPWWMQMDSVTKLCLALTKELNVEYKLRSKKITAEEIFAATGLLPAIMKRAEQLSVLCFSQKLGLTFDDSENAMLGVQVSMTGPDEKLSLSGLACVSDVLIELTRGVRGGDVNVDELLYDQVDKTGY